jgi:hypothetical protein
MHVLVILVLEEKLRKDWKEDLAKRTLLFGIVKSYGTFQCELRTSELRERRTERKSGRNPWPNL